MEKLLNETFFHFGTNKILKELWLNIQMDQIHSEYIKPYGGLYSSHKNNYFICDWLVYKEDNNEIYPFEGVEIKYKRDAKCLIIDTSNDYKNLKDSGLIKILDEPIIINKWYYKKIITELIEYEKISEIYDLLYINNMAHENLRNFSIKTMLALKPNAIEYYKPIIIEDYKTIMGEKTYIKEPTKDFYKLISYTRSLFKEINEINYNDFIIKLSIMIKEIKEVLLVQINKFNIPNIDKNQLIDTILRNIYREKYMKVQKRLTKKY